jgi:hypothetical protein
MLFSLIFAALYLPGCVSNCPEGTNEQADGSCVSECPEGYVLREDGQSCVEGCQQDLQLVGVFKMADATLQINEDLSSGLSFSIEHKIDIDMHEAGCVNQITLAIEQGGLGCRLDLGFESDGEGRFNLADIRFDADSYCPNFDDSLEGSYKSVGTAQTEIKGLPDQVPMADGTEQVVCIDDFDLIIEATGLLQLEGSDVQHDFEIEITLAGDAQSIGYTSATCEV